MDFNQDLALRQFTVDGDVFRVQSTLPFDHLEELMAVADLSRGDNETEIAFTKRSFELMRVVLSKLIVQESWDRFSQRLGNSERPIGLPAVLDIVRWLVGLYSKNPTQVPSDSGESSMVQPASTSTVGVSQGVVTIDPSTPIESSI